MAYLIDRKLNCNNINNQKDIQIDSQKAKEIGTQINRKQLDRELVDLFDIKLNS